MQTQLEKKRIWITGGSGLVGTSLQKALAQTNCEILAPSHQDLDLTQQDRVMAWVKKNNPEIVFALAGRVGGIEANRTKPCEFLYTNMMIAMNTIHACAQSTTVEKLLYLGPACAYPKNAPMPLQEESLLSGALEPTNEAYALAKIAGLKLCQYYTRQYKKNFIAAISTNTYGVADTHQLQDMHVISALFAKFRAAINNHENHVTLWGSGKPLREFIHTDDLASALIFLMQHYHRDEIINIGTAEEVSIANLAHMVKDIVGFKGNILWDTSRPDGMMRKVLDSVTLQNMGWTPRTSLQHGLEEYHTRSQAA